MSSCAAPTFDDDDDDDVTKYGTRAFAFLGLATVLECEPACRDPPDAAVKRQAYC